MNLLVNVDQNWGIGKDGDLLVFLKGDLQRFKEMTMNKVVVLGRETLKTFPSGKPLKNRVNIIMTRDNSYTCEDAIISNSIEDLFEKLKEYDTDDVFIIGGESIYRQLLPYVKNAYITKFNKKNPANADKYFPNLDQLPGWKLVETSDSIEEEGINYNYNHYINENHL